MPSKLTRDPNISVYAKALWSNLFDHAFDSKTPAPWKYQISYDTLMGELGVGRTTLSRAVNELETTQWLTVERRPNKSNRYFVHSEQSRSATTGDSWQSHSETTAVLHRDHGSPPQRPRQSRTETTVVALRDHGGSATRPRQSSTGTRSGPLEGSTPSSLEGGEVAHAPGSVETAPGASLGVGKDNSKAAPLDTEQTGDGYSGIPLYVLMDEPGGEVWDERFGVTWRWDDRGDCYMPRDTDGRGNVSGALDAIVAARKSFEAIRNE